MMYYEMCIMMVMIYSWWML